MRPAALQQHATRVKELTQLVAGFRRLVVFTHDHPDPDAMASAWLLARIGENVGVPGTILCGGQLGRAENRTMIRVPRIPIRLLEERGFRSRPGDGMALVDTQPGAGNHSFPPNLPCHIVIDHHPARRRMNAEFVDIHPEIGGCTTLFETYAAKGVTVQAFTDPDEAMQWLERQ